MSPGADRYCFRFERAGRVRRQCGIRLIGLLGALLLGIAPASAATVIDTFDETQSLIATGPPSGAKSDSGTAPTVGVSATILGGERDAVVSRTSANEGTVELS